jgi:hypothetical protein
MSKKTPSQDFNYKFEHQWGGEDTWYTKGKRWANKQKFPISHLALGAIEWLRERWVDGRVEMEMASIDKQVKYIGEVNLLGEGPKSLAQAWHLQALKIRFLTHGTGTGTMQSGPGNE